MVEFTRVFDERIRAELSKTIKDPFQMELLVVLNKIEQQLHHTQHDQYEQNKEIISKLHQIEENLEHIWTSLPSSS